MKHIVKSLIVDEPDDFTKWKALANDNWQPNYENMPSDIKNSVKNSLRKKQGGICCYCERRLDMNDSHIEHFRPQSDPTVDSIEYSNMLCSCQNKINKTEPLHAEHQKATGLMSSCLFLHSIKPVKSDLPFYGMEILNQIMTMIKQQLKLSKNLALAFQNLTTSEKKLLNHF